MHAEVNMAENRDHLRTLFLIGTVALLALVALALLGSGTASAACTPPGSGDWTVLSTDVCTHSGTTLTVNGDMIIQNGGNLTISSTTLQMAGSFDGDRNIDVQGGGTLNALSNSVIKSTNPNIEYTFHANSGSIVRISDSTVQDCGYGPASDASLGFWVESDLVVVDRSDFMDNYAGIFVKAASPVIRNSTFQNGRFGLVCTNSAKPELFDNDINTNTDGIMCIGSDPKIINNDISDNTDSAVYLQRSKGTLTGNTMQDNRFGVAFISSSPVIRSNNISFNRDGIRGIRGDPIIEKNEIEINTLYQVYLDHAGGRIQDNDITGSLNYSISTWYGVFLQSATTTVRDNRIHNIQLNGLEIIANSDVIVTGNDMLHNYASTIWIESSNVRIENNNVSHAYIGIRFATSTGMIKGNTFYDNRDALDGYFLNQSFKIEDNYFLKNYRSAINLDESHPIVTKNTFEGNLRGLLTKRSLPQVTNNVFKRNVKGAEISDWSDIYFANNTVMHGNYTVFASKASATMINNTIQDSYNYSMFFSNGSYGKLVDNVISGNDMKGVYFVESDGWLINNTIFDSGTGIYASRSDLKLEGNHIYNTEVGLFFNRTDFDMSGDLVEHCTVFGLVASEGTVTIFDVVFNDTEDGVYLYHNTITMENVTISNGTKALSVYHSPKFLVKYSTFENNKAEAVYLTYSPVTVVHSMFRDNKYGIRTHDSPITVRDSTFREGTFGIYAEGTEVSVKDCTIELMNDTGINAFTTDLTVINSRIAYNKAGMFLENVTVTVLGSQVLNNTDEGIWVNGTDIVVRDTRFVGNRDGLFDLGDSIINVFDCNMSSNEVFGIYTTHRTVISNITISRKIIIIDNTLLIRGNLRIVDGGHAMFLRAPIEFYVTKAGDAGGMVETGGRMEIKETLMWGHTRSHPAYKSLGYYFIAQKGSSLTITNSSVMNCGWGLVGLDAGLRIETHYTNFVDTMFHNNSIGLYIHQTSFNGTGIRFDNNKDGLRASEGTVNLVNSTFKDSAENDIGLSFSTAILLNTKITFNKVTVADESSILTVKWFLHVSVTWNDGQPVDHCLVLIRNQADQMQAYSTNDQGYIRWIKVKEYQQKGSQTSGYFSFSPLVINATEKSLSVETTEYIATTTTINIIMKDDSPPAVEITSPADGSVHYVSELLVIGTSSDQASDVTNVEVSVDGETWVPATGTTQWFVNITVPEGHHIIMARATDARGNVYTTSINVEVDLTSPMLEVDTPSDGLITNATSVVVRGRVHVGSGLILNDVTINVTANGTFEHVVTLREGENPIHLKAIKGFEEMEVRLMVFRDTAPPEIQLVHPTLGIIVNRSIVTVTVSSDEEVTFFINGVEVDTFGGQADLIMELQEGKNTMVVRAIDRAGNTNETEFVIQLDVTRPQLDLERPNNPVFTTTKRKVQMIGRTEPGATLKVNGEVVEVGADGNFSLRSKLRLGRNTITLESRDQAGNSNVLTLEIKRKEVIDNSNYYWLIALAVIVGVVADVGTFVFLTRYYRPKGKGPDEKEGPEEDELPPEEKGRVEPKRRPPKEPEPVEDTEFEDIEFEELPMEEF